MSYLSLTNIHVRYEKKTIIKKFNLTVAEGEKILLFGKSGGGKSSILKLILGFIPPSKGMVRWNNAPLNASTVQALRNETGYVSQDCDLGEGTVAEIVNSIMNYKANRQILNHEKDLFRLLKTFQLPRSILKSTINSLSGGERQRIALIIVLLRRRSLLLLDEITSALDRSLKKEVIRYIINGPWTAIIVSHDRQWLRMKNIRVVDL